MAERGWMDVSLSVVIEPLARGKRVLFVGAPQSPAASRLQGLAAKLEVAAAGGRQRPSRAGGAVRAFAEAGEWDLILITEATPALLEAGFLRELAESLHGEGRAVLCVDAEPSAYDGLYRTLRQHFASVRMLGQAPFFAHSIVDFAAVALDPSVTFDGSLIEGQAHAPARYIAVCGARAAAFDAHSIIQYPGPREAEPRRDLDAARARLEHAEKRLDQAQREIARSGQKLDELRHELARSQAERASSAATVAQQAEALAAKDHDLATKDAALLDAMRLAEEAATSAAATDELDALEEKLRASARENLELRGELARRATLVRDVLEDRMRDAPARPPAAQAPPTAEVEREALQAAMKDAQRRAASSEAKAIEAGFARDEALAALRSMERKLAEQSTDHARLDGRARGLHVRWLDEQEARGRAEAQLTLARAELEAREADLRHATANLLGLQDQLGLALARQRAEEFSRTSATHDDDGSRALQSQLDDARHEAARLSVRIRDAERERDALASRTADLERALEEARRFAAEMGSLQNTANAAQARLEADAEVSRRDRDALDRRLGFETGRALRLASSLRGALAEAAKHATTPAAASATEQERDALRLRMEAAERMTASFERRLAHESGAAHELDARIRELEVEASRSATQRESARLEERVRVEDEERERARLAARIRELEAAGQATIELRQALKEARMALDDASKRVPATVDSRSIGDDSRARVDELRRGMEDRELMLRTMTAQLRERDDRIQALEVTLRDQRPGSASLDGVALAERDARIERLTAELADLRRHQGAEARARELEHARGESLQRDAREVMAAARLRMEALLAQTTSLDPAIAQQVVELANLLRRG